MDRGELPAGLRRALVVAITLGGLLPRAYRLGWGLPDFVFFDSRFYYLKPAYDLVWEGTWAPNALVHTPLLGWILAALYLPRRLVVAEPVMAEEIVALAWIGRLFTLALAVASIPLVYAVARRLLGTRPALFAAAAFAFLPLPALEAHRTNADLPMVFLALLSVHQAVRAREDGPRARLFASFALAGLAGAMKLPGLAIGSVPAWVALSSSRPWTARLRDLVLGGALAAAVVAAVVLPVLLTGGGEGVSTAEGFRGGYLRGRPGEDLAGVGWWYARWVYWLVAGFPYLLGWTVYLAGLAGLATVARESRAAFGILAAGSVPFFLVQGGAASVTTRYCLLLTPFFAIAAGHALDAACRRWRRLGPVVTGVVLGYAVLLTGSQCLRIDPAPQEAVRAALDEMAARRGRTLVVAYPWLGWLKWDPVGKALRGADVRLVGFPDRLRMAGPTREATAGSYRRWLASRRVDVVLFPAQEELVHVREGLAGPQGALLEALLAGTIGFREVAHHRVPFATESLYLWSDPALDPQLPVGIGGYRLFASVPTSLSSTVRPSGSVAYTESPLPVAP